jgi:hypothetical protein
MVAAGIIIVKGWQTWGPSGDQLRSIARRAMEVAQAWNRPQPPTEAAHESIDPNAVAPAFPQSTADTAPSLAGTPGLGSLPEHAAPNVTPDGPAVAASQLSSQPASTEFPAALPSSNAPASPTVEVDRMSTLMSRLEELGGIDPDLVAWGTSGKLYRFRCRARWGESPMHTRHFESVATEPLVAVEDVLAKVQAWRAAERGGSRLR